MARERTLSAHGGSTARRAGIVLMSVALWSLTAGSMVGDQPENPAGAKPNRAALLGVPLSFEANQGQSDGQVKYLSRGDGYSLFLTSNEVVFTLRTQAGVTAPPSVVRMKLLGAERDVQVSGADEVPGAANYFIGNDPKKWRTGISAYGKVNYQGVYPGIDAVFYGNQRQLEYDFVVAPGADPKRIALGLTGVKPSLDMAGNVLLRLADGELALKKPVVYQNIDGGRRIVDARYAISGDKVSFQLGKYDHSQTLVIDPVFTYLTYLGGTGPDQIGSYQGVGQALSPAQALAIDSAGDVYVTGFTTSTDFPVANPYQSASKTGTWTAFVSALNPSGTALLYSTYLGGSNYTAGAGVAWDAHDNALYVVGTTSSPDFPLTAGAYQTILGPNTQGTTEVSDGQEQAFVAKFSASGQLTNSTLLGGNLATAGFGVTADSQGRAYVVGFTQYNCVPPSQATYACFPTTSGAAIPAGTVSQNGNGFVSVFDPKLSTLLYSTILGDPNGAETNTSEAFGVAVDPSGNFYVVGITGSPSLPTTPGAFQPKILTSNAIPLVGFAAKFGPVSGSGASLTYLTYLEATGMSFGDLPGGVVADGQGNAYVGGYTNSPTFPATTGAYSTPCPLNGARLCPAVFVTKVNPTGTGLVWSALVEPANFFSSIQLDAQGNVYVAGDSSGAFTGVNALQPGLVSGGFVSELDPTGSTLLFSTLLGSSGVGVNGSTSLAGLAVDAGGNIYAAGNIVVSTLPTTPGVFQPAYAGGQGAFGDGFIAKIGPTAFLTPPLSAEAASLGASGGSDTIQVDAASGSTWTTVSNTSWITITGGASGSGSGVVTFSVAANTGAARSGTVYIGGQAFTISQEGASASGLSFAGSMAQIASAGGWDTALTLVNLGVAQGEARLNFYANDGTTPQLPFTFPQHASAGTALGATFDELLNVNASLILDTTGPSQTAAVGSSQLLTSGNIGGFAIFTYTPSGQAAVVPLETRNASSYLLPFDDTGAITTGLAIDNVAASAANVNVIIRDDTGAQIGTGSISLPAQGHNSFMLTDTTSGFPVTVGKRGTVEFDRPAGGQISVIGLRANAIPNSSNFALTTIPLLAGVGTGGGVMAHIASGAGWQTTFTLVNTGASAATANLNFYGDAGAAVSLPLSFPQTGALSSATSVSQSIAPGASLIVVLQDSGGATATTGSAVLTTSGNIGGFAVFRYNPTGQEAVVPLETMNANSYILAFDETGSLTTGLAIANATAQAANVNVVVRDDTGAQIGTGAISLKAQSHTSFMLTGPPSGFPAIPAGVRGTIEFDTPTGGQIAPLGLRASTISGGFTITTIPLLTR